MNLDHKRRTLKQLLSWFVGSLLLLLLLGNFVLNIVVTRNYLETQLQSHAQDAATSLGLSLSTVIDARDQVLAERMIDSIFDSGDYQRVVFRDTSGKVLIERESSLSVASIPDWFINWVRLQTPRQSAQVMAGWSQLGKLEVESHPGYAYLELWQTLQTQLIWFGVVLIIALVVLHVFITILLAPLRRVEQQAHEMANRRFDYRAPMPNTRELARVATAMNSMADTLGKVFSEQLAQIETLREQALHDALTGLNNREGFDRRLKAELESQESVKHGSLLLIKLQDFGAINQQHGRAYGDALLHLVAAELKELMSKHEGSFAARRAGPDFSLFLPGLSDEAMDDLADKLLVGLRGLQKFKQLLNDDLIHMGIAGVREDDDTRSLLSKADMALSQAQNRGVSSWQRFANLGASAALAEVRQASEWLSILRGVLQEQALVLHLQPVFDLQKDELLHQQVLVRIELADKLVVAGVFLPMAVRFGLMVEFDRLIVEKVISTLAPQNEIPPFSISLSEAALTDSAFMAWFEARLARAPEVAKSMMVEVSEHVVNANEDALKDLCSLAAKHGVRVAIERFGGSSVPFSYLRRIEVDAIKVDHSFVRDLDQNPDNQLFLRSAIQLAHSQAIQVIAVGVESPAELECLKNLGMDAAMGYHLGRPEARGPFS